VPPDKAKKSFDLFNKSLLFTIIERKDFLNKNLANSDLFIKFAVFNFNEQIKILNKV